MTIKIKFVKGILFRKEDKLKRVFYSPDNSIDGLSSRGMFMRKDDIHFMPVAEGHLKREDIFLYERNAILVVIQDNPLYTLSTLIHELCHWGIYLLFRDSKKIHKILDRRYK